MVHRQEEWDGGNQEARTIDDGRETMDKLVPLRLRSGRALWQKGNLENKPNSEATIGVH